MIGLILPSFEQYRYVRELRKQKRRDDEQQSRRQHQCQPTKTPALTTHNTDDDDSGDVTVCATLSFFPHRATTTSRTSAKVNDSPVTSENRDCGVSHQKQLTIARATQVRPIETTNRHSYHCIDSHRNKGNETNQNDDIDDETVIPQQGPIVAQSSSSLPPSTDTKTIIPPLSPILQSRDGRDDLPRHATSPLLGLPNEEVSNFNIRHVTQAKLNFSNVKSHSTLRVAADELSMAATSTARQQADTSPCPQELSPEAKNNSSDWIPTYTVTTLTRRRMLERANASNNETIHIPLMPVVAPTTTPVKQKQGPTTSTDPSSGSYTATTTSINTTTPTPALQGVWNAPLSNKSDSTTATTTGASSSVWDSPETEKTRPPKRPWFQRSATNNQGGRARRRNLQQQNLQLIFKKAP